MVTRKPKGENNKIDHQVTELKKLGKKKVAAHLIETGQAALSKETPKSILTVQGLCPLCLKKTGPKTIDEDEREDALQTAQREADY